MLGRGDGGQGGAAEPAGEVSTHAAHGEGCGREGGGWGFGGEDDDSGGSGRGGGLCLGAAMAEAMLDASTCRHTAYAGNGLPQAQANLGSWVRHNHNWGSDSMTGSPSAALVLALTRTDVAGAVRVRELIWRCWACC